MRLQTTTSAPCVTYGLANHAGFLFERQRTAMRQSAFARARSATTKRKARDSDDSDDSNSSSSSGDELPHDQQQQTRPSKRVVLHGLKRMRVSSPPTASTTTTTTTSAFDPSVMALAQTSNAWPRTTIRTNDAMSDTAMDDDSAVTSDALVPVGKPRNVNAYAPAWSSVLPSAAYASQSELAMPPTDASCRALVLFESAVPRSLSPRIELVESDDDARPASSDDDDDDDSKPFVRFEEIHDDDDECTSMEID